MSNPRKILTQKQEAAILAIIKHFRLPRPKPHHTYPAWLIASLDKALALESLNHLATIAGTSWGLIAKVRDNFGLRKDSMSAALKKPFVIESRRYTEFAIRNKTISRKFAVDAKPIIEMLNRGLSNVEIQSRLGVSKSKIHRTQKRFKPIEKVVCENVNCHQWFHPKKRAQLYCSQNCGDLERKRYRRMLARSKYPEERKACEYCQKEFTVNLCHRGRHRFCSDYCAQKQWHKKKVERGKKCIRGRTKVSMPVDSP